MVKKSTAYSSQSTKRKGPSPKSKPDLSVTIGKIRMKNPLMVASGTFEYCRELQKLISADRFGAIVAKTITLLPQEGNRPPRTCETPSGMLNAIGLQSKGVESFLREKLPELKKLKIPIIVSIAGRTSEEFAILADKMDKVRGVAGIELNLSCPNVIFYKRRNKNKGYVLFAQDKKATQKIVASVKKATSKTVIVKLSPNVTDIVPIARVCQEAGADALSLINTLIGMAVDVKAKKPRLGNIKGGLSGPAIKPVALNMVWNVYNNVAIPIIGMGGITDTNDALEFFMCGAAAVAVGTAHFVNPRAGVEIVDGVAGYLKKEKISDVKSLVGSLNIDG